VKSVNGLAAAVGGGVDGVEKYGTVPIIRMAVATAAAQAGGGVRLDRTLTVRKGSAARSLPKDAAGQRAPKAAHTETIGCFRRPTPVTSSSLGGPARDNAKECAVAWLGYAPHRL
jgi:hypothetical protein